MYDGPVVEVSFLKNCTVVQTLAVTSVLYTVNHIPYSILYITMGCLEQEALQSGSTYHQIRADRPLDAVLSVHRSESKIQSVSQKSSLNVHDGVCLYGTLQECNL